MMHWGRNLIIAGVAMCSLLATAPVSAQRPNPLSKNSTINVPFSAAFPDTGEVVSVGGMPVVGGESSGGSGQAATMSAATADRNSNLRAGPGVAYPIVGHVQAGESVAPVAQNADGSWYMLDEDVWIAAFLVDGAPSDLPTVDAKAASTQGDVVEEGSPDPEEVIGVASAALKETPGDAIAYLVRAAAYMDVNNTSEALADLDRALELDPGLGQAYILRGLIHTDNGNLKYALNDFALATQVMPASAEALVHLGIAQGSMGNYVDALANVSKAIELDPELAEGYFQRASLYQFRFGASEMAIEDYSKVIELAPSTLSAYNNRAILLSLRGEHKAALADMASYARYADNGLPPHVLDTRAFVNLRAGDYTSAIADYEAALDAGFESVYVVLGLGIALAESGDMGRAMPLLQDGLAYAQGIDFRARDGQLKDLINRARVIVKENS